MRELISWCVVVWRRPAGPLPPLRLPPLTPLLAAPLLPLTPPLAAPQKCLDKFAQHGLPGYCIVCPDKGEVDEAERLAAEAWVLGARADACHGSHGRRATHTPTHQIFDL